MKKVRRGTPFGLKIIENKAQFHGTPFAIIMATWR
jgi:hypothetical protein